MNYKFSSYLSHSGKDLPAGLVVFLVALPLCLGIALASGAPLFAGIITGVIGGIVVGFMSGSHLSVSGPAAGLTVIVFNAINELGSYEVFLVAVVLAGAIQLVMGYARLGIIGMFFPSSVIKGMLAAIGIMLILQQIQHFVGFDTEAFGAETHFLDIPAALTHIHLGALIIGIVALGILLFWENPIIKRNRILNLIPGALIAVVVSILINELFKATNPFLHLDSSHLVRLPLLYDPEVLATAFKFPDFSALTNPGVYVAAFTIAIIASLETLLSVEAVDKLDPFKRRTPNNRELKAQGVGNMLSGMIGGIPLTAVIVRSSANLNAGGRTKMAAVYHGVLLLVCAVVIPKILNLIPLSALAAILLLIGYKLAKPSMMTSMVRLGRNIYIPFFATIIAILATDLLKGIIIGMGVGVFIILRANYKLPYFYKEEEEAERKGKGKTVKLALSEHVTFLNKASLQLTLENLPENSKVTLDGSRTTVIDYDALEVIDNFRKVGCKEKNIELEIKNLPQLDALD